MNGNRVLVLVLAGGEGGRLDVLTRTRAKPALPYAGVYRLIDFALSNCVHSGLSDVWVVQQYEPHALDEHLAGGRPWDLDRTYGGLRVLPPFQSRGDAGGWYGGNADAIYRNRAIIREFAPDLVLLVSADHIYTLDYRAVIAAHTGKGASVTLVTTPVPRDEANRFGVVKVDDDGRVTDFVYKPDAPESDIVTCEVFVFTAAALLDTLDALAAEAEAKAVKDGADSDNGEEGENGVSLGDYGEGLLPRLVAAGRAFAYPLDGYWRDVGTVESYWRSHMELLALPSPLTLDHPRWPVLTYGAQRAPARVGASARIADSLIAPGCTVDGEVTRSVLAPGVVVERGASVHNAVVLHDAVIRAGAVVQFAIVDEGATVEAGASVGAPLPGADTDPRRATEDDLTVVGGHARISQGAHVPAGARIEPDATVT